jgi:hypothetical protein
MKISKSEGISHEQIEVLVANMDRINLVSAISQSIQRTKQERKRLEIVLAKVPQYTLRAPGGTSFVISSHNSMFDISTFEYGLGSYESDRWGRTIRKRYTGVSDQPVVFLADSIETARDVGFPNDEGEPAAVFAYSPDRKYRCKITNEDAYKVAILTLEHVSRLNPEGVLNQEFLKSPASTL